MSKSLLLAALIAAVTLATCGGKKARSQTVPTPIVPIYELSAIEAACENGATVLHFLHRETEGEKQGVTKIMFCIDRSGKQVLRIDCSRESKRCETPIVTRETVPEFRRFLRSMGDDSGGIDA